MTYAVNDANVVADSLATHLGRPGSGRRVVKVVLDDVRARKANILSVLARLTRRGGSKPIPCELPATAGSLAPAEPEDIVVLFFAGHGLARDGRYVLIPHDLGYKGPREQLDAEGEKTLRDHGVSDRELQQVFEEIDSDRIAWIIDSCYSGQVLDAEEKRRGPLNSHSLAQLAYEKGMPVLAAARPIRPLESCPSSSTDCSPTRSSSRASTT